MPKFLRLIFAVPSVSAASHAAEIKVLSAGAFEPGIEAFAHQLKRDAGHGLKIRIKAGAA